MPERAGGDGVDTTRPMTSLSELLHPVTALLEGPLAGVRGAEDLHQAIGEARQYMPYNDLVAFHPVDAPEGSRASGGPSDPEWIIGVLTRIGNEAIEAIVQAMRITAGLDENRVGPIAAIDHLMTFLVEEECPVDWEGFPPNWLDQWEEKRRG